MAKVKVWKEGASGQPDFPSNFKVTRRWEGNCTDVMRNSNKFYHAEIQVASDGRARIFTMYGRVGKTSAKEYRYYVSEVSCISDYETLIRKKRDRKKNPYREIDLAITSVGSSGAKQIKKPMTGVSVKDGKVIGSSAHHAEVQRLVSSWFGSTGHFVEMNLKCPLGQLTKEQIDKGRLVLDDCKSRVASKSKTTNDIYDQLTSQFYSLIPHVLPHRIDPNNLRLNNIDRIMEKHDTLDTFLDAKNVASVLGKGSAIDDQYKKLRADLGYLEPSDPVHKWIEKLVLETRARNHAFLGRIKVFNIFTLSRNGEDDHFMTTVEKIAKEVNGCGERPRHTTLTRPDLLKEECKLFTKANVWPLWHGTRPQNMVGIISRGLLIRPSGAVYTGSMFGDALYHAENSSKSMNYTGCRGAYWSGGSKDNRAFLFLEDVIVGKPHIVTRSQFFKQPPRGCHSVYAVPGSGLYNSENMTYMSSGKGQQHRLRYIVEFQSNM
jgi:predicted DNA-binding WGR domain protein